MFNWNITLKNREADLRSSEQNADCMITTCLSLRPRTSKEFRPYFSARLSGLRLHLRRARGPAEPPINMEGREQFPKAAVTLASSPLSRLPPHPRAFLFFSSGCHLSTAQRLLSSPPEQVHWLHGVLRLRGFVVGSGVRLPQGSTGDSQQGPVKPGGGPGGGRVGRRLLCWGRVSWADLGFPCVTLLLWGHGWRDPVCRMEQLEMRPLGTSLSSDLTIAQGAERLLVSLLTEPREAVLHRWKDTAEGVIRHIHRLLVEDTRERA